MQINNTVLYLSRVHGRVRGLVTKSGVEVQWRCFKRADIDENRRLRRAELWNAYQ